MTRRNLVPYRQVGDQRPRLPVPDGHEEHARASSNVISTHTEVENTIEGPTTLPHLKTTRMSNDQRVHDAGRQRAHPKHMIPSDRPDKKDGRNVSFRSHQAAEKEPLTARKRANPAPHRCTARPRLRTARASTGRLRFGEAGTGRGRQADRGDPQPGYRRPPRARTLCHCTSWRRREDCQRRPPARSTPRATSPTSVAQRGGGARRRHGRSTARASLPWSCGCAARRTSRFRSGRVCSAGSPNQRSRL